MKYILTALLTFLLAFQPVLAENVIGNGDVSQPVAASQGGLDSSSGPTGITKVVCFGDSTCANTAGAQVCDTSVTYVTPNASGTCFLDYVGLYYGAQVANIGLGGTCNDKTTTASSACNSASSGQVRYQNANTAGQPGLVGLLSDPTHTLVLISYTLNDAIKGDTAITPTIFNTNLSNEVSWLETTEKVPSKNIIIMGPSPVDAYGGSSQLLPLVPVLGVQDALVAYKYNTRFVDSYTILASCYQDGPWQIGARCDTDGLHPNATGGTLLGTNIVNATFANAVAGIASMESLAAVWNQPLAVGQRRLAPNSTNQVSQVDCISSLTAVRCNPYENWINSVGTSIYSGPLNDSLSSTNGLVWEIKTSSPLFVLDGSGNAALAGGLKLGSALGVAYGGTGSTSQNWVDLTTNQTIAGSKSFSSGIPIGTAAADTFPAFTWGNSFGNSPGVVRCGSLNATLINGVTGALIACDDQGNGWRLALGGNGDFAVSGDMRPTNIIPSNGIVPHYSNNSVVAYPWHPSSDPSCSIGVGGTTCNTSVTMPVSGMRCAANAQGTTLLGGIGFDVQISYSGATETITYTATATIAGGGTVTFSDTCN